MIKSRPSYQILNFPLWVLMVFWLIARRKKGPDADDLAVRLNLLQELYYSLPLPRNIVERALVSMLIRWIYKTEGPVSEGYWNFDQLNA